MVNRPVNAPASTKLFLVLHEVRATLCVTPKVASTSIIKEIMTYYEIVDSPPYHLNPALVTLSLNEVQKYIPNYKRAIFVRNPFDRLVANYYYHIKQTNLQNCANMRRIGFKVDMSFEAFLKLVIANTEADPHYAQQCWLSDRFDFVGKYENLSEDWDRFCHFIGLKLPKLSWTNKGEYQLDYQNEYSHRWKSSIAEAYRHDLKAFSYEF